uniref:Adenylate/guanylate cyclase domain-containing protein n=1 Tax=candidate division WOR-3 bacterium TaxID=2052148 RepID=A0A7C4YHW9_UNCW3
MDIKKEQIVHSIASFLPYSFISSKGRLKKDYEIFNSVLLFADISGFTAMSEKLATLGKEGSEEVNKIINRFFEPLINVIYKWDGDIYCFGGDAFLAFFPEENGKEKASRRGLNASLEIMKFVKSHTKVETKLGDFSIRVHIGLTKGNVYFQDLKNEFFLGGKVANYLMEIIDYAEPGEIVVSSEIKNELKDINFEKVKDVWKYTGSKKLLKTEEKIKKTLIEEIQNIENYIPEWLLKRIELKPYFDYKDGEHRKITIVFLHFSGIPYDENPENAKKLLQSYYEIVKETIEKYDGWISRLDVYKDSERILAVFGFPFAHEDDEKRAVLFTYEIFNRKELKNLNLRGGINSGSVFAAPVGSSLRREYTILGDAVNIAARFAAKAENRTIVVGENIFNKTFSIFDYEFLGEKEYKGKSEKIKTYKLYKKKEIEKKTLTKWISESERIVGREKEIEEIKNSLKISSGGKGRILCIAGEPGIGKSRLVQELIRLSLKEGFYILQGNCISYGSAFSYHPWIDILNDFFNLLPEDSVKTRMEKIKEKTAKVDKKLIDWLPVIGEVMGIPFPETSLTKYIDAKLRKQRVFDIIFDFIKFNAKDKPVALIIEDLHWADTASVELVNYIGRNIENLPIFFTLVYRPLKKKEEFLEKEWTKEIILKELPSEKSIELVENLLGIKDIPDELKKIIINKSQGNPFYIEELVKSLIEQGYIIEEKGWKFTGDFKSIEIPDTVEAVILSRIDRLKLEDRNVLQVASILGREFDEFLIKGIYPEQKTLKKSLSNLERLDLIKQEKGEGEYKYFFKHILTQEVAYGTLSFARKKELHCKVGSFLETELKDRKDEFVGLLSYHFYLGEDYDKSLLYSVEAGEKAKKVYANEEAIEFFTRAIDSYEKLEGSEKIKK